MTPLYLSRAKLRRDGPVAALAQLLVPDDSADRADASHRLVWSLFADGADRRRDFLWREERPGQFMALSARPPENPHGLFDLECKPFQPALTAGDRLGFTLRANPVVARATAKNQRGKRHDVVMDALRAWPPGERAEPRPGTVLSAGRAWFTRQGAAQGFAPVGEIAVDGYERLRIPRRQTRPAAQTDTQAGKRRSEPIILGVIDVSGILEVLDPDRFLAALSTGFGRGRAFGCGLMLIRRAR